MEKGVVYEERPDGSKKEYRNDSNCQTVSIYFTKGNTIAYQVIKK
jgi:hypothetical protein